MENVIEVKDVSKRFKVYADKGVTIKEKILSRSRNKYEEHTVLDDISFSVQKGESIGLIGHNGCGKSTLLKLLTRIMYPDEGSIKVKGRVSSLLELGAGFHPDMSGLENIYINASIFGLGKKEIDNRLKDIIEFSELGSYIDNPVRTYSSGMYMRLAFSVAINVNADILLVDEILAVGDVNFQTKCYNKLMDIKRQGTTIVLVSHSTEQIERVCERSIWIHDGKIRMDGKPRKVHNEYLKFMNDIRMGEIQEQIEEQTENIEVPETSEIEEKESFEIITPKKNEKSKYDRRGTGESRIEAVETLNKNGKKQKVFSLSDSIEFKMKYKCFKPYKGAYFGLSIFKDNGMLCYGTNMSVEDMELVDLMEDGAISIEFSNVQLMQGKYLVDVCIAHGADEMIDYVESACEFEIVQICREVGTFKMEHNWKK